MTAHTPADDELGDDWLRDVDQAMFSTLSWQTSDLRSSFRDLFGLFGEHVVLPIGRWVVQVLEDAFVTDDRKERP
jgi:hypothetical protein